MRHFLETMLHFRYKIVYIFNVRRSTRIIGAKRIVIIDVTESILWWFQFKVLTNIFGGECLFQLSFSHPFSLIIWASSMMNLPSLYFWLDSYACSYFQPRVVLQQSQYMSATAWRPVKRTRSSAGPQPIFTTELKR